MPIVYTMHETKHQPLHMDTTKDSTRSNNTTNNNLSNTEDITQYIKLTHNSRGYTWDIKINDLDVDRITKLNDKMEDIYGNKTAD